MAWIESHQELGRHPKTRRLARILGISLPAAVGHLHYLWWWALDFAEDGDLSGYDSYEIAEAAMWEGDPDEFVDALIHCGPGGMAGFLDRTGDGGLVLHDWDEYAGRLIERRARDRERKRRERAAKRASRDDDDVRETSAGRPQDVHGKSGATVPITEPIQYLGGGIYDNALGTREDEESATSGYQPATATDVMIADDSITPGRFFERLWGVYPPTIDQLLTDYADKLHPSAIKWAIWEARLAGQRRASYLRSILDRLVAQGLTTAAAAQQYEEERRQRDRDRPPAAASMDGAPNASAYTEIDRETVERYAALIYAAGEAAVADDASGSAVAEDKPP